MFKWYKNWVEERRLRKQREKEECLKIIRNCLNALKSIKSEIEVSESLKKMGVEGIRMCYPDRYGDIGPGDENPDNWK